MQGLALHCCSLADHKHAQLEHRQSCLVNTVHSRLPRCQFRRAKVHTVRLQVHNWRCLRCTYNPGKGISAKESTCTQVRSPGLTTLRKGQAGEAPQICCRTFA